MCVCVCAYVIALSFLLVSQFPSVYLILAVSISLKCFPFHGFKLECSHVCRFTSHTHIHHIHTNTHTHIMQMQFLTKPIFDSVITRKLIVRLMEHTDRSESIKLNAVCKMNETFHIIYHILCNQKYHIPDAHSDN